MNRTEHLLTILAEECVEVAQRASKALRFGLDEAQPGQPYTNAERIMIEFDDLLAAQSMLQDEGLLPTSDPHRIAGKVAQVEQMLLRSQECGTLSGNAVNLPLDEREAAALAELCADKDMSQQNILRAALRLYQAAAVVTFPTLTPVGCMGDD